MLDVNACKPNATKPNVGTNTAAQQSAVTAVPGSSAATSVAEGESLGRVAVRDRWVTVGAQTVAIAVLAPWTAHLLRDYIGFDTAVVAIVIMAIALFRQLYHNGRCWFAARAGIGRVNGQRQWRRWPPPMLPAMLGFVLGWVVGEGLFWPQAYSPGLAGVVAMFVVGVSVAHLPISLVARSRRHVSPQSSQQPENDDWLVDDRPIDCVDQDRFGHRRIADRIAARLTSEAGPPPSIALIGPYGSGKTSIANMVRDYLSDTRDLLFVRVSLWTYDSPEAAVRGVLGELTRAVGERVSAPELHPLPIEYAASIDRMSGVWGVVWRFLARPSAPRDVLARLDRVLTATVLRAVLWVEDADRFAGSGEDAQKRFEPVQALLHELDQLRRVTVVLADTSLTHRIDARKIARFVETMPMLTEEHVSNAVAALRHSTVRVWSERGILPAVPDAQTLLAAPSRLQLRDELRRVLNEAMGVTDRHTAVWLARLAAAPRTLKSALRDARDVLDRLIGEIDIDDVIVLSVLRVAAPAVHAWVTDHIQEIRRAATSADRRGDLLNSALSVVPEADRGLVDAVRALLIDLFPYLPDGYAPFSCDAQRPQGIAASSSVDYFARYQSRYVDEMEQDQPVLQLIQRWKTQERTSTTERQDQLARAITAGGRAEQVERFARFFTPDDRIRLLEEMCDQLRGASAASWGDDGESPGMEAVWRMLLERRPLPEMLLPVVRRLRDEHGRENLPLARFLNYYFTLSAQGGSPSLIESSRSSELLSGTGQLLLGFIDDAARLARALRGGSGFILKGLVRDARVSSGEHVEHPFDRWHVFANTLLDAAEYDGATVLRQAAVLCSRRPRSPDGRLVDNPDEQSQAIQVIDYWFDRDRLAQLFSVTRRPMHLSQDERIHWDWVSDLCAMR